MINETNICDAPYISNVAFIRPDSIAKNATADIAVLTPLRVNSSF